MTEQKSVPLSNQISKPLSYQVSEPLSNQVSEPLSNQVSKPLSYQVSEPLSNQVSEPLTNQVSEPLTNQVFDPLFHQNSETLSDLVIEIEQNSVLSKPISEQLSKQLSKQYIEANHTNTDEIIKMYIFINSSLKMQPGKIASQVGHIVHRIVDTLVRIGYESYPISEDYKTYLKWNKKCTKIILKATENQLLELMTMKNAMAFYDAGPLHETLYFLT